MSDQLSSTTTAVSTKNGRDGEDDIEFLENVSERKRLKPNSRKLVNYSQLAVNPSYCERIDSLQKVYNGESNEENVALRESDSFLRDNFHIIEEPFQVIQLKQFVHDENILKSLKEYITSVDLNVKNNDLLSLKQSADLKTYPDFKDICNFFSHDVREFLQDVTGLKLNSNVALTISRYDENDYLLCHDDQLEERKIAFILYLVDNDWTADDGGQLELFRCNSDHQPLEIVQRLTPEWNLFNFFVVQPFTYHQVSEVKTSTKSRWSINGWFHSDDVTVVPRNYSFPTISTIRNAIGINAENAIEYDTLVAWINKKYLIDELQGDIQKIFVDSSEIQLEGFLNEDKFEQLSEALQNEESQRIWKQNFCPVLAKYEYIPEDLLFSSSDKETVEKEVPDVIREAIALFSSEAFFLVLSNLTGISMHKKAIITSADNDNSDGNDCKSTCRAEVRRWQQGDYTLSSDIAPEFLEEAAIDFMLFFNVKIKTNISEVSSISNKNNETEISLGEEVKASSSKVVDKKPLPKENSSSNGKSFRDIIEISDNDDDDNDDDEDDFDEDEDDDYSDLPDSEDSEEEDDDVEQSGIIHYLDDESDKSLLKVKPTNNCLNLVYRTKGTQRIMKYINSRNETVPFNEISFVYYP